MQISDFQASKDMMMWLVKEAIFSDFYKQTFYGQKIIKLPIVREEGTKVYVFYYLVILIF